MVAAHPGDTLQSRVAWATQHIADLSADSAPVRLEYALRATQLVNELPAVTDEAADEDGSSAQTLLDKLAAEITLTRLGVESDEEVLDALFELLRAAIWPHEAEERRELAINGVLAGFSVPLAFAKPDGQKRTVLRRRFERHASRIMTYLQNTLEYISQDKTLSSEAIYRILVLCASVLGDENDRWSNATLRSDAEDLLRASLSRSPSFVRGHGHSANVAAHAQRILTENVQPFFVATHRQSDGRMAPPSAADQWRTDGIYEDQKWKTERADCVEIFAWTVRQLEHSQCVRIQGLLFPPLLILLDDYEPRYKTLGAQLTHHVVVTCSTPMDVRRSGLGDVFFDSLLACLTHHSEPDLLRAAFPCVIALVPVIEVKGSEAYASKLERVVEEGVLRGLSFAIGGKLEIIRILLQVVPEITLLLGLGAIRFLKPLLGVSCEILELHEHDVTTQIIAADAAMALIIECWPRVPDRAGMVLKAAATAWHGVANVSTQEADTLRRKLQDLCAAVRECCANSLDPDLDLLLRMDEQLYGPLVNRSPQTISQ
ncbi:hypothetical protein HDU87_002970 [Geranomyces variabilis]|uniref:Uncharacterized protein n=1 Tax=Geranomyces variabilis TaxID=109894 RepID=A0AAD5TKM1_9FUNG|nr:hypothetical protein HDU87_002970 [Geranomyces variabilis]